MVYSWGSNKHTLGRKIVENISNKSKINNNQIDDNIGKSLEIAR